jgi:hypothetical protein
MSRRPSPHTTAPLPEAWRPGPPRPRLATGELHLWLAELSAPEGEPLGVLSAAEHEHAAGILAPAQRRSWQLARVALRVLLGRYLSAEPGSLELDASIAAMPPWECAGVEFGLAHAGDLALCAFSADSRVGVELAPRSGSGPGHEQRAFLSAWVAQEASMQHGGPDPLGTPAGQPVWGRQFDLGAGRLAAVGASRPPRQVRRWRLEPLSDGRGA